MTPTRRTASGSVISVTSGRYEEFSLDDEPPVDASQEPPSGEVKTISCPSCGAVNPAGNRHCQECGARLDQGPLPTAPRPAVQATAGVRAAIAISGLLFVVIVVALLFNIFSGNGTSTQTTIAATPTTQPTIAVPSEIDILDAECTPEGLGSFTCSNLISGSDAEYQVNWEEITDAEDNVTVRLVFRQPMIVSRIDWSGIEDPTRFKQNYRARGILIDAQGSLTQVPEELQDTPGLQVIDYAAVNTNWIEFTIESAFQAEIINENVFRELAINEIVVWGRPANPTTNDTDGSSDG